MSAASCQLGIDTRPQMVAQHIDKDADRSRRGASAGRRMPACAVTHHVLRHEQVRKEVRRRAAAKEKAEADTAAIAAENAQTLAALQSGAAGSALSALVPPTGTAGGQTTISNAATAGSCLRPARAGAGDAADAAAGLPPARGPQQGTPANRSSL